MWRDAKSFSPSAQGMAMKRFSLLPGTARMRRDSTACFIPAHPRPCTPGILESDTALKRPCPMRAQYGWPFH
ncbi:hypothetical protein [Bradyrhizobium sp. BR13661]|uniref:hypothetical protein n=1 Tax=Bradyrhizobium sp. BR13661 TaxID=2940622 RepID=UPI0024771233|nr:hypothetical protein [Bradyrhizobium sp. BR13661]MDH6259201.1 hypothetical protein [Bradyrhizobium sp. BR13661]